MDVEVILNDPSSELGTPKQC